MNRYFIALWMTHNAKNGTFGNRVIEIAGQMTEKEIRNQESIIEDSYGIPGVEVIITNFIKME